MSFDGIEEYLDRGPFVGRELRDEMLGGFCLSGSRGAAFFSKDLRQKLDEESREADLKKTSENLTQLGVKKPDWDFYTDGTIQKLERTIKSLQKLGVRFESIFKDLDDKIKSYKTNDANNDLNCLFIGCRTLQMLQRNWQGLGCHCAYPDVNNLFADIQRQSICLDPPEASAREEQRGNRRERKTRVKPGYHIITLSDTETVRIGLCFSNKKSRAKEQGYKLLKCTVVSGKTGDGSRVQVIAKAGLPIEEVLMQFHSSHIQCFVGGHAAAHFYHQKSIRKESIFWTANSQAPKSAATAKKKYIARGFRYKHLPGHTVRMRRLGDAKSLVVPCARSNLPEMTQSIPPLNLSWREDINSTRLMSIRTVQRCSTVPGHDFWNFVDSRPYLEHVRRAGS